MTKKNNKFEYGEIYCYFTGFKTWEFFLVLNENNVLYFGKNEIMYYEAKIQRIKRFLTIKQFENLGKNIK